MSFDFMNRAPGNVQAQLLEDIFGKVFAILENGEADTGSAITELANAYGVRRCPKCGRVYTMPPATSRHIQYGEICPAYGMSEALEAYQEACQAAGEAIKKAAAATIKQAKAATDAAKHPDKGVKP